MDKRPKLLVFDLDYTLWNLYVDTTTPPFKKNAKGNIVDLHGYVIKCFPEVPGILKKLKEDGYTLAIASRTGEINGANQLIELFGWSKYFTYKEIFPGRKTTHFNNIKSASKLTYGDMIFFDDESRNIHDLTQVGVLSILVKQGVTEQVIKDALNQYKSR